MGTLCEGCGIEFTVTSGSDPSIAVEWSSGSEGGSGRCEVSEGGTECLPVVPCTFNGTLAVATPPGATGTLWSLHVHSQNMQPPFGAELSETSNGVMPVLFVISMNSGQTSLCKGLEAELDNSKAFKVEVYKDGVKVFTGYLYCGLCTD